MEKWGGCHYGLRETCLGVGKVGAFWIQVTDAKNSACICCGAPVRTEDTCDILCPTTFLSPVSRLSRLQTNENSKWLSATLPSQISSGRVKAALHPAKGAPSQYLPSPGDCLRKLLKSAVCESQESTATLQLCGVSKLWSTRDWETRRILSHHNCRDLQHQRYVSYALEVLKKPNPRNKQRDSSRVGLSFTSPPSSRCLSKGNCFQTSVQSVLSNGDLEASLFIQLHSCISIVSLYNINGNSAFTLHSPRSS